MSTFAPGIADIEKVKTAYLMFNLAQGAGTYDLATVSGGDVLILTGMLYDPVAAAGLTSAVLS